MARFTHKVSGVRVAVADGKALSNEWEPAEKPKPKAEPKKNEK